MLKKKNAKLAMLALGLMGGSAHAQLSNVGPTLSTAINGGYPQYYQDSTGLALELCVPKTQEELAAGRCLILPADLQTGLAPEIFPTNFSPEHFYFAAGALTNTNGGQASLTLGLEAAFGGLGGAAPNNQVTFGRVRVRISNLPTAGDYKVIHPYGEINFPNMNPGDTIFFTEDIGVNCAQGDFSCALQSKIGPFLYAAISPGGTRKPDFVAAEGSYLSDGVNPEFVGGSPFGTNFFRVIGPDIGGPGINSIEVDTFSLVGRLHTAPIASPTKVRRSSYKRSSLLGTQVDYFATASAGINAQAPLLSSSFALPDANGVVLSAGGSLLDGNGLGDFWGQSSFSAALLPAEVSIFNNGDAPPSIVTSAIDDEVKIDTASYDAATNVLSVSFSSTDLADPNPRVFAFSADGVELSQIDPVTGLIAQGQSAVTVPVSLQGVGSFNVKFRSSGILHEIKVASAKGGRGNKLVEISPISLPTAIATNDTQTTAEDTAVSVNVTRNDSNFVPGSVAIVGNPLNGTLVVNPPNVNGNTFVRYTPRANFSGTDTFTYTVTGLDGIKSNLGVATVTVTPVNDAPVAANDTSAMLIAKPAKLISVLANDTDIDGTVNPASLVIIRGPGVGQGTASVINGAISYTPPATIATATIVVPITYQVMDNSGALSNVATLNVTVYRAETITVTAQYRASTRTWTLSGTSTIAVGNAITVYNGAAITATTAVITNPPVTVAANGSWSVNVIGPAPTTPPRVSARSSIGGERLNVAVTVR